MMTFLIGYVTCTPFFSCWAYRSPACFQLNRVVILHLFTYVYSMLEVGALLCVLILFINSCQLLLNLDPQHWFMLFRNSKELMLLVKGWDETGASLGGFWAPHVRYTHISNEHMFVLLEFQVQECTCMSSRSFACRSACTRVSQFCIHWVSLSLIVWSRNS